MQRRELIKLLGLGTVVAGFGNKAFSATNKKANGPLVLSTWYNQSVTANVAAW